jgi:hypothetical protein
MDDDMPRRRGGKAAAIAASEERGLLLRMFLHSPKDMIAGVLAAAAISAIVTNALLLQAGRHPSPMFGASAPVPAVANPLPRPRPMDAAPRHVELPAAESKAPEKAAEPPRAVEPKRDDAMTHLVTKATAPVPSVAPAAPPAVVRPPAPVPVATPQAAAGRRIAGVQRALTEYGYGQLKPTGMIGADTQAAITKFERERKLPVTGQMSDRLVRELSTMIGRPID